jgi:phospholipid/cholesterol/gamma-HCH transport system ATP-binding protein
VEGRAKRFDGPVLDGLDLSVAAGPVAGDHRRLGPGQVGDHQVALGLVRPDAGKMLSGRREPVGLGGGARRRSFRTVGVLFQGAALFDSLTVWENVAFRLLNADGVPRKEAKARRSRPWRACTWAGMSPIPIPSELSGGMQKRVGLARAVVANPEILFFDEPTTGLDPITAAAINELIVEQVKHLGCHGGLDHPRPGLGPDDRRRDRHAARRQDRLARSGRRA